MTDTEAAPSRPGARRRPRRRGRLVLIITGVLVLALVASAGAAYWKLQSNIESTALPESSIADEVPEGVTNILFLGSDSRDLSNDDYGKNDKTRRSDAMLLVHLSAENERIDAVQIPRDTVTELPPCDDVGDGAFPGGFGQINSALNWGPACSVAAIEKLSGVRIEHFVELDFEGFATMVNALGGVPVCLDEALVDADAKLDLPDGEQTLDGKDALALARTRKAVGDGSDIGRLGHQQMVMTAIVDRARSGEVLARPDRLFKFLNALTSSITVDDGISSIPALSGLARRAQSVPTSEITFLTMPWGEAPTDPNRVVPTEDATTVFEAIADDVEVPLEGKADDDAVRTSPVRVLNAARTPGLATEAQTSLLELGYTVTELLDAQQPAEKTRIFVGPTDDDRATAEALDEDLGLDAELIEQDVTGVWLILGRDRIDGGDDAKPKPVEATSRTADTSLCA